MNKITLSMAAMAAVSVGAYAQDATEVNVKKAEIQLMINSAISDISSYRQAVKDTYLPLLSEIQSKLNGMETVEDIEGAKFGDSIEQIKWQAQTAELCYVAYYNLYDLYYNEATGLKAKYSAALTAATAGDSDAPWVKTLKGEYKAALEVLGVEAIKADIESYAADPAKGLELAGREEEIKDLINTALNGIEDAGEDYSEKYATTSANVTAQDAVNAAITAAQQKYDTQLPRVRTLLTDAELKGEAEIYQKWLTDATSKLNSAMVKINQAKSQNTLDNASTNKEANLALVAAADAILGNDAIVSEYTVYKNAYEEKVADINIVEKAYIDQVAAVAPTGLKNEYATESKAVTDALQAWKKKVNDAAEDYSIVDVDVEEESDAATAAKNAYISKTAVAVASYNAYRAMAADVANLTTALEGYKTAADVPSATDNTYIPSAYFEAEYTDVSEKLKALSAAVNATYVTTADKKTDKASVFKAKEGDEGYASMKAAVVSLSTTYNSNATTARTDYDAAYTTWSTNKAAVNTLSNTAKNQSVTHKFADGTKMSYNNIITGLETQVNAIETALTEAKEKTAEEHLTALAAAKALTVVVKEGDATTVEELVDAYPTDKGVFDKVAQVNAANTMLTQAQTLKSKLGTDLATVNLTYNSVCGNHWNGAGNTWTTKEYKWDEESGAVTYSSLNAMYTALNGLLDALEIGDPRDYIIDEDNVDTESEDFQTKYNSAVEAIASVTKVNDQLKPIKAAVEDLETLAEAAMKDKEAYDAVWAKATDATTSGVVGKITTARRGVNDVEATYTSNGAEANTYYSDLVTAQENLLEAEKDAIEASYKAMTSVADKSARETKISGIATYVSGLKAKAETNLNQFKAQKANLETANENYSTVRARIAREDYTTAGPKYLDLLDAQKDILDTQEAEMKANFREGKSDANHSTITDAIDDANTEISNINQLQQDELAQNVITDNNTQHDNFLAAYNAAYSVFQNAIADLNKFATATNEAAKAAMAANTETHADIYGYANTLIELKATELEVFNHLPANTLYNSESYIADANAKAAEITQKLEAYRTAVNEAVFADFRIAVNAAETNYNSYNDLLAAANGWISDMAKGDPFSEVYTIIRDAKTALGTPGSIGDKFLAVNVDTHYTNLATVDTKLAKKAEEVAEAEYYAQYEDLSGIISDDKEAVAEFQYINPNDYSEDFAEVERKLGIIANEYAGLRPGSKWAGVTRATEGILARFNVFRTSDFTVYQTADHTNVYKTASEASAAKVAYEEALVRVQGYIADSEPLFDEAEEFIMSFMSSHKEVSAAVSQLESLVTNVLALEGAFKNGNKTETEIKDYLTGDNPDVTNVTDNINNVKVLAVSEEYVTLGDEIIKLKDIWNQVVALGDSYAVDENVKAAKETLDGFTHFAIDNIVEKLDANQATLLAKEAEIAGHVAALTNILNAQATANALAELNTTCDELSDAISEAKAKAEKYADLNEMFAEKIADVESELTTIRESITENADNILFYKDVYTFDLAAVQSDLDVITDGDEGLGLESLDALYATREANFEAYTTLKAKYDDLVKSLEEAWTEVSKYTRYSTIQQDEEEYDVRDVKKLGIEVDLEDILEDLNDRFMRIRLTAGSGLLVNTVAEDIQNLRIESAYDDITIHISELETAVNDITIDATKIVPTVYAELVNERTRIINKLRELYNFSEEYIDGMAPDAEGVLMVVDYLEDAYPKLNVALLQLDEDVPALAQNVKDSEYVLGDANKDGKVNVADYDEIRQMILQAVDLATAEDQAKAYAADVTRDGKIDVADLSKMSNYIMKGEALTTTVATSRPSYMTRMVTAGELTTAVESEETTLFGKTVRIALNVNSTEELTGGQMDITLPAGMKLAGVSAAAATQSHDVAFNEIAEGVQRVLISSVDNTVMAGNGTVAVLDVEIESGYNGGDITVQNILFTDSKARSLALTNNGGNATTGIDSIQAATVKERIYSVGGQMKKALQRGLNIIVGENGEAKTVLKK